ncbi:AAA family ATPase [Vibrio sp. WJH972]
MSVNDNQKPKINLINFKNLLSNTNTHINFEEFKLNGEGLEHWHLKDLRQINLLTGSNNSRKSRLLRQLFLSDTQYVEYSNYPFDSFLSNVEKVSSQLRLKFDPMLKEEILTEEIGKRFKNEFGTFSYDMMIDKLSEISADIFKKISPKDIDLDKFEYEFNRIIHFDGPAATSREVFLPSNHVYIPILRGLRPLHHQSDTPPKLEDSYLTRTKSDYFQNSTINFSNSVNNNKEGSPSATIYSGLSMYTELKRALLGTQQERKKIQEYENYLSRTFFDNQDISLVPRIGEDVVYISIGKEERAIFDLGDGIQSLIIITFPIFISPCPTTFYIEEPELNLHPGMQRILIDAFHKFPQHYFFMTTHSNHLIDIAQENQDISVYRISRVDDSSSTISVLTEYSDALDDLGVRASSVLLANCSIWVEGVTDKRYLRAFLKKYLEENTDDSLRNFKENLHYIFAEYQGSNITHWNFSSSEESSESETPARKLSKEILLIADNDISNKGDRVKTLERELGDNFILLEWKEIENYIPAKLIVEAAKKRWETFRQKSKCHISNLGSQIEYDKFQSTSIGIGTMLEEFVSNNTNHTRKFYADESGTIKDKVKFCNTVLEVIDSNEVDWKLTPELTALCEQIFDHIKKHN